MTAFAAFVSGDVGRPDPADGARIAGALAALYGTTPASMCADGCLLLTSPLHDRNPPAPFVDEACGVIAVGQVVLEDPAGLSRRLGERGSPHDLALIVRAYARWGEECTSHFAGEFAFALWDPRECILLSARDGLGLRRLYVAEAGRAIVITNLLAAALAHTGVRTDLDEEALVTFLRDGAISPGRTPYRAVRELSPGHTLRVATGARRSSLSRHWRFPHPRPVRPRSDQEILEGYRHVLQEAAADRLREGRAAILLSGGIDSTTIAAAARDAVPECNLHAFTAVYERLSPVNELPLAREAGDRLRIPVTAVEADRHDALDTMWREAPTPQPVDEPTLRDWRSFVAAAAGYSTVALYGEDGDTLFLPPGFRSLARESNMGTLFGRVCRYVAAERRLPYLGLRLRERIGATRRPVTLLSPPWLTAHARNLLVDEELPSVLGLRPTSLPAHPTRPRTQSRLCLETARYLAAIVSSEVTRQRIEMRCPLLDSRVLRFVVDVPAIPWCQNKRLPRQAYRHRLPLSVTTRPKKGVAGWHEALVHAWQRSGDRHVSVLQPPLDAWIDRETWGKALDDEDAGRVGVAWRVLQLNAWLARRHELVVLQDRMCIP